MICHVSLRYPGKRPNLAPLIDIVNKSPEQRVKKTAR
jgi:hypothetical protein